MKVRDIIRLLEQDEWYLKGTKGSHRQYKHPTKSGRVTLPGHPGDDPGRSEAMIYVVVYEKTATGWSAYVPDLPGVITTSRTKEKAKELIREAIAFHIEGLREDKLPIPEPAASAEIVTVT